MKPIRSEREQEIAHNCWTGQERPIGQTNTDHIVTDSGGLNSDIARRKVSCDCGCLAEPGGYCAICQALACIHCFCHCDSCQAPCCAKHAILVSTGGRGTLRLCPTCRDEFKRKRFWGRTSRLLLSPFVRFKD